ncbi:MAG: DNA replication/repair protein RecF [Armatimonadota bacterium]|nr:DNA replication/repair protein RecF [bacterium]
MHIKTLNLTNFRNYEHLDIELADGLNVLVGRNAQGKSGILEAVYVLATSKSHRTSRDMDLIRIGEGFSRLCAEVVRSQRNDTILELALSRTEHKSVKINKVKHPKIGDIVGQLNAVIFSNSDIDMVRGEPSGRRRFLNLEISQVSPHYIHALGRYKRVLDQRNNLLREIKSSRVQSGDIDAWDMQLAQYGATIISRRAKFIGFLAGSAARIYSDLTGGSEELGVSYKPSVDPGTDASEDEIAQRFAKGLAAKREIDIMRGTTTSGPHRDDVSLSVNGIPAREFASQGQQRSAAIALKLAEIDLMEEYVGESPVVLLDDVMAELDEMRRARVLEVTLGRCQTFITTTSLDEIGGGVLDRASVWEVRSGRVAKR